MRSEARGRIVEVRLGATKAEGGSRDRTIVIGGDTAPPPERFKVPPLHKPVVSLDTFDMEISLPGPVRECFGDALSDPIEWARVCVERYGAEMVQLHLMSTRSDTQDRSPHEAAKTVEELLQAVKVPIMVGGGGDPKKDPLVLEKVAEVAEGERIVLNSARLDIDYRRVGEAAKRYGHVVVALTTLNLDLQRRLNRELLAIGLGRESIVMDPLTAALGYGLHYTFSTMERIRLAGILGDPDLQMPLASGTANAWSAREAWLRKDEWGPRELRGPLWEATTAIAALLAGCDLFMMLHPLAAQKVKELIDRLCARAGLG